MIVERKPKNKMFKRVIKRCLGYFKMMIMLARKRKPQNL